MLACGANNIDIIKELINAGADVLRGNDDNLTPAHICAKMDMVKHFRSYFSRPKSFIPKNEEYGIVSLALRLSNQNKYGEIYV